MNESIQSFVSGFPNFMVFGAAAGGLLIVACVIYVLLTPMKELELLRKGNNSAGLALGGVIIGLAIPISSCLASSVNIFDLVIWGSVSLLLQILAFRFVDILLRDLPKRIEDDEAGAAILLVSVKIASALILAAALWDPALNRMGMM